MELPTFEFPAELSAIEVYLSRELGTAIHLACVSSNELPPESSLTPGEQARLARAENARRKLSFRAGRAALKRLVGSDHDTSKLVFPNARLSLSHSGKDVFFAVAAQAVSPFAGIGVDIEINRTPKPGIEKFFLTPHETAQLSEISEDERPHEALRLWSIKEALFKSDPRNVGCVLSDYHLLNSIDAYSGEARSTKNSDLHMKFSSVRLLLSGSGFIAVALTKSLMT